jgi:hypothetical protein
VNQLFSGSGGQIAATRNAPLPPEISLSNVTQAFGRNADGPSVDVQ